MNNNEKIIIDLCGGTGAWSKPYKDAGYDVRVITLPEHDVMSYEPPENVYGILAAPPCTMFSDARTNAKTPRDLIGGWAIVQRCLDIIRGFMFKTESDQQKYSPLKFWALENPWFGRLKWFLGHPPFIFDPWEFGDAYKKRTAIWGYFNFPQKSITDIKSVMSKEQIEKHKTNSQSLPKFDHLKTSEIHNEFYGKLDRQSRRAITPQGFARAFYMANK